VQGRQVSLPVGNKLSGQFGGFDLGAFSVLTDRTPAGEDGQILSVARVTHPILAESKFGVVFTHGDPTGLTDNTVAGADFQYRNSNLFGNKVLQADLLYMKSFSSAAGNDESSAVSLNFPNEPWSGDFLFKQIGADFTPALGFVNRTAIRQYVGTIAHLTRYRNTYLNTLEFGANFEFVTGLQNTLESRAGDVFVNARSRVGDQLTLRVIDSLENVPAPFLLPRNVPVFSGTYQWANVNVGVRTFNGRLLTLQADVTCCRFYDGDAVVTRVTLIFRPSTLFEINVGHQANAIDLPTGAVDIHLATTDAVVNFTPDMQVALQGQYDNISENFALSTRYRWEYRPGNELFVGLGETALISNRGFIGQTTQATIRLGHTFRF
jgi:hypothetical protein